jgi:hypothetical protein
MNGAVAVIAKRYQVLLGILARMAAEAGVVYLKV